MQDGDQRAGAAGLESSATTTKNTDKKKQPRAAVSKNVSKLGNDRHRARVALLLGVPILAVVALVWLAGNMCDARYSIGGTVVSSRTSDSALSQELAQASKTYRLNIVDANGGSKFYTLQDIGMQPDTNASLGAIKQQRQAWTHRLQWWRPLPITLATKVDMATLNTFVARHVTNVVQPARNATIKLQNGEVRVTSGSSGKEYGLANPVATILTAAEQLQPQPLRLHLVPMQPAISEQYLGGIKARLEGIMRQHIVVKLGSQSISPKPSDIANWLQLTPKPLQRTVAISVNKTSVQAYIAVLAAAHEHPARAQVSITGGTTIPGEQGIVVANQPAVATTLTQQLLAAKGAQATLAIQHTPYSTINAAAYSKWFEVDLTNHRMYAYEGTKLVRTFLISAGKYSTPTIIGDFAIYSKYTSQTMFGADYIQPNVPWVNYFYRDFAIHGNYWSPASYFGNVNASHGCVGVQDSDAVWIYSWATVGTRVVTHV